MVIEEKTIGKKVYKIDDTLAEVASRVITEAGSDLFLGGSQVKYMLVYPSISKTVAGRCIKASRELRFFSGCDYIVQMSGDLWESLDEKTQAVLMLHELMHVHVDYDKDGNEVYKLRDHDVQDFASIIRKHGIDWIYTIRNKAKDLDGKIDANSVKI